MRRLLLIATLMIGALALPGAAAAGSQVNNFEATLTGAEEVPANASAAVGEAEFELSEDGNSLRFRLEVEDIQNAFMGHIHCGPKGVNGPIVVWLFPRPASTTGPRLSGEFEFEGTVTQKDLVPNKTCKPKAVEKFADLVSALRAGNAYANVHTNALPAGEIRGQILGED